MNLSILEQYIETGNSQDLELLLSREPDLVKQTTSHGISPLLLACYYQKPQLIQIILKYITTITIHEAAAIGLKDHVEMMVNYKKDIVHEQATNGATALGMACHFNKEEIVKLLLQHHANPNAPSQYGYKIYPLHMAIQHNNYAITSMLINAGADTNTLHQSGLSPLHLAVQTGNVETIILLLEHGAQLTLRTPDGKSAADLAAERGYYELAQILKLD